MPKEVCQEPEWARSYREAQEWSDFDRAMDALAELQEIAEEEGWEA